MQQSYNLVSYKIILKEEFLVIQSHVPLLYAGDALKQDEQFITELVKIVNKNPVAFRISFKSSWLTDKEFMLKQHNLNQHHQVLALNQKNRHPKSGSALKSKYDINSIRDLF